MNTCIEFVLGVDIVSIFPRNKNTLEFFYNLVCLKVCFFLLRWVGQLVVHILHEQPVRLQLYAESVSDVRPHFQLDYPSLSSLIGRIGGCLGFPPLDRIVCPYVEGVYCFLEGVDHREWRDSITDLGLLPRVVALSLVKGLKSGPLCKETSTYASEIS